jgi:hypothetical protein
MRTSNLERMQLLVDALESGEYEQTTSVLRRDTAFCCLGVACDISGIGQWVQNGGEEFTYRCATDFSMSVLPMDVVDWLGLERSEYVSAEELPIDDELSAITMNDTGESFAEIAQKLRVTYLEDN